MNCIRKDCPNEANYAAVLVCPIVQGQKRATVRMALDRIVCFDHTHGAKVGDYVSGKAWKTIVKGFRQRQLPAPLKKDCFVEFTMVVKAESHITDNIESKEKP